MYIDYSKACIKMTTLKKTVSVSVFKTNYRLMQVKRIAECSKGHSAILLTLIKLPFVIKTFGLSIFWLVVLHRFYCIFKKIFTRY